ncbi:hypothetical protein U5A82_00640 [Sphingobium sp. CR2-8]|uniref:hypothetical protein n=1 Tax=Sphingobium sp. CR2-8 TaxID=1306534 RepID=UPI002DBB7C03|nr:hypothetical protein [Sphingobium sp. CR2-8]MEC3909028.1 hypothetical protein [Sphingobium sp. CR2-8]
MSPTKSGMGPATACFDFIGHSGAAQSAGTEEAASVQEKAGSRSQHSGDSDNLSRSSLEQRQCVRRLVIGVIFGWLRVVRQMRSPEM